MQDLANEKDFIEAFKAIGNQIIEDSENYAKTVYNNRKGTGAKLIVELSLDGLAAIKLETESYISYEKENK